MEKNQIQEDINYLRGALFKQCLRLCTLGGWYLLGMQKPLSKRLRETQSNCEGYQHKHEEIDIKLGLEVVYG